MAGALILPASVKSSWLRGHPPIDATHSNQLTISLGYDGTCSPQACMHEDLGKPRKNIPSWLMPSVGYTLSGISLIWVIHSFNLKQTLSDLASLDWRYVSIAVVFELSVYLCHAWRWNILLRSVARPSY